MIGRRASLWLLAFALVTAQTLGLVHRIVHLPGAVDAARTASSVQGEPRLQAGQKTWTQALFSGHEGDPACRLFDLLGAGAPLPYVATLPVLAVRFLYLAWPVRDFLPGCVTHFEARGPPVLR